jgi:hypothetical protein
MTLCALSIRTSMCVQMARVFAAAIMDYAADVVPLSDKELKLDEWIVCRDRSMGIFSW